MVMSDGEDPAYIPWDAGEGDPDEPVTGRSRPPVEPRSPTRTGPLRSAMMSGDAEMLRDA